MKSLRTMKAVLVIVLSLFVFPMVAQSQVVKETSKAKTVIEKGKTKLVLKAGQQKNSIENNVDNNTWRVLDSLVTAPYGSPYRVKDANGYSVFVQRANVSSNNGLLFYSGSRFVAITQDDLKKTKVIEEKNP